MELRWWWWWKRVKSRCNICCAGLYTIIFLFDKNKEMNCMGNLKSCLHCIQKMNNWMMILFFLLLNFFFLFLILILKSELWIYTPFIKKVESQCWIQIEWRTRLRIELIIEQNKTKKRPDNPTVALCIPNEFFTFPFSVFFFPKLLFFLPLLYFFFLRRNIHYKRKNKKIREKWRNKSLKNHFLVFGLWFLDSFLLFSGSSPPISNSFFWNFIFSLWKVGKGWKATQHKRKEKTEIVENKITKQNL